MVQKARIRVLADGYHPAMDEPSARLSAPRELAGTRTRSWRSPPWRSPPDQPPWTRPALLAIAALAGLAYAWGIGGAALESSYGAIARSMSSSWHDFFFGAFDPSGTVTVNKLPGAVWPMALSLRIFGFHVWAVVLPQVLEGVLTVLVLFRATRRLAGPLAAIVAAAVLAASPITVALNRGNVADSVFILLAVLAADATVSALIDGRLRSLLLAGVWIGLGFQAKMLEAWLLLPALALAYLVSAPASLRLRVRHVALAGVVTVVVSLSWMTVVSLVPAGQRPYVDGAQHDSLFSQVFGYNGFDRLGHGKSVGGAGEQAEFLTRLPHGNNLAEGVAPSWHRLLDGLYGRDIAWLLPAALIAAACVLVARRGSGRRDLLRASVLLWGLWLLALWAALSDGIFLHSYYVAVLAPAIAALCGTGVALAWPQRGRPAVRWALAGTLLVTVAYGIYLLHGATGVPGWLRPAALCLGVAGALALLAGDRLPHLQRLAGMSPPALTARVTLAAIGCALLLPGIASALIVTRGLGPFAAPFEPASATESRAEAKLKDAASARTVERLASRYGTPIVFAIDTSQLAAPYILASGREILPIGGFEGGLPSPTLAQLRYYVSSGRLRAFLIPPASRDPRIVWVYRNCRRASSKKGELVLYECQPG
jgi:4-amino-4-deoxy-L-arabinose transferase-like glycosyltransferase